MKIKNISIENFKAISNQQADFNGCSAIITAGNNKGKSTMLRGLIDRFRGEKPEIILKEGESKGFSIMELTDGSKIEWKFTEKTESFAYTTKEGIKMTTGVLSAIGQKYFGVKFDVDKFIQSSSREQMKTIQKVLGLDLSDIEDRYKIAYAERTDANKEVKRLLSFKREKPEEVKKPDVDSLISKKNKIQAENESILNDWRVKNEKHQTEILNFNDSQSELNIKRAQFKSAMYGVLNLKGSVLDEFIDFEKMQSTYDKMPNGEKKELTSLPKPELKDVSEIEAKITNAQDQLRLFDSYERDLQEYNNWIDEGKKARELADKKDEECQSILKDKNDKIKACKLPSEFSIDDDGLKYNGLPISNNQLSSSAKYIAALKLGALSLGFVKTMHFDASFLDKKSLSEIQEWANANDLQLLIERPDFDGGEIKYNIM